MINVSRPHFTRLASPNLKLCESKLKTTTITHENSLINNIRPFPIAFLFVLNTCHADFYPDFNFHRVRNACMLSSFARFQLKQS